MALERSDFNGFITGFYTSIHFLLLFPLLLNLLLIVLLLNFLLLILVGILLLRIDVAAKQVHWTTTILFASFLDARKNWLDIAEACKSGREGISNDRCIPETASRVSSIKASR